VITGAVTLVMATCTPFLLLRVIPFVEQSALHSLEGVRARATRGVSNVQSSPIAQAARSLTPTLRSRVRRRVPTIWALRRGKGEGDRPMPPLDGESPSPPIGEPRTRGGHVAYHRDEMGPVVGWHFDE